MSILILLAHAGFREMEERPSVLDLSKVSRISSNCSITVEQIIFVDQKTGFAKKMSGACGGKRSISERQIDLLEDVPLVYQCVSHTRQDFL